MLLGSGVGVGVFVERVVLSDEEAVTVGGVVVAVGKEGVGDMGEGEGEDDVSGLESRL